MCLYTLSLLTLHIKEIVFVVIYLEKMFQILFLLYYLLNTKAFLNNLHVALIYSMIVHSDHVY